MPTDTQVDAHLDGHVRRHPGRVFAFRKADPIQEFGGPETVPEHYGADKLSLHGVPVHPMPAEASSHLLEDADRKQFLTLAGRFWLGYLAVGAVLGVWLWGAA